MELDRLGLRRSDDTLYRRSLTAYKLADPFIMNVVLLDWFIKNLDHNSGIFLIFRTLLHQVLGLSLYHLYP